MKIGVLSSGHIPSQWAHSIAITKNANGFAQLGHDVTLFSVKRFEESLALRDIQSIHEYYDLDQPVSVELIHDWTPTYFEDLSHLHYLSSLYRLLTPNSMKERLNPERRLATQCAKRGYDMCYCRTWDGAYYAVQEGIPTIVEAHSPNTNKPKTQQMINVVEKDAFRGFVTIAEKLRRDYIKAGFPEHKTLVLQDGVDVDRFDEAPDQKTSRESMDLPTDEELVIYTGSLYPEKGIGHILDAAKRVTEATFVLVGGPTDQIDQWRHRVQEEDIENVYFEGFVPISEIPTYLSAADALIMPYDTTCEDGVMDLDTTSPLKLFEYMAAQRPIVSTDIPAISRTIDHGMNGLLAPPNDIETLANYVRRVLNDDTLANELSKNAHDTAENYTWEKRCKRMLETFL